MASLTEPPESQGGWSGLLLAALLVNGAVLVLVGVFHPDAVHFASLDGAELLPKLSGLLFVALVIERALEVWLTPLRGPDADRMKHQIRKARPEGEGREEGTAGEEGGSAGAPDQERALLEHRLETRRLAFLGGLTVGVVVSALGVRALSQFVDVSALPDLQGRLFLVADVLLTGALLGGGADGIHKVLSRFLELFGSG